MPSRLKMGPLISELQEWHRLAYMAAPTKAASSLAQETQELGQGSEPTEECWEAEGPRASRMQGQWPGLWQSAEWRHGGHWPAEGQTTPEARF